MLAPRLHLAGKFAFAGPMLTSFGPRRWLSIEVESGRRVVAVAADAGQLSTLEAASGVKHRHLASIIQVVRDPDAASLPEGVRVPTAGGIAIAEYIPGRTLLRQLEPSVMNPSKAVAWTLRLAESLQALHQAGAVHGALSPRSVVAEPEGRKIAPVLAQLVTPPLGSYCPPERLKGSVETSADDVWALAATLFTMLTREPPYRGNTREALLKASISGQPRLLADYGVDEPVLQEILRRSLCGEKRLRVTDLAEFVQTLDGWERDRTLMPARRGTPARAISRGLADIVGGAHGAARDDGILIDDQKLPEDEGTPSSSFASIATAFARPSVARSLRSDPRASVAVAAPEPTPSALAAPPSKRPFINPFEKKRHIWPLIVLAALAGGGGVYLAVAPQPSTPAAAVPVPLVETAKPRPQPANKLSATEQRDECVASYFPADSFAPETSFEFVCGDNDFRELAGKLQQLARPAKATFAPTPAQPGVVVTDVLRAEAPAKRSVLGWYELPAAAIIRRHCCSAAPALSLPETAGWCEQLQSAVRRVADESGKSADLAPAARAFDKAVSCLFANKLSRPYSYEKLPNADNRQAFQQFLGRAAVSEARR